MIANQENCKELIDEVCKEAAIDTETTGLYMYDGQGCREKGDRLFSIIISDEIRDRYFNFQNYDNESAPVLNRDTFDLFRQILEDPERIWFLQNAKYDMKILAQERLFIRGKIYDLSFLDRIHFNQHLSYNLDSITKRWGEEKFDSVKSYIDEQKLYEDRSAPHLNKELKSPKFYEVPFKIISEYGLQDGRSTYKTGKKILSEIQKEDAATGFSAKQMNVVENESRLVHTLFHMEHLGIKIDRAYCEEARAYYEDLCEQAKVAFKDHTGEDFVKGTSVFEKVFESEKDKWTKTLKDNWAWDAKQLAKFENPAARFAQDYAEAKKQLEYFQNFLFFCDSKDLIHPDFMQAGTVSGRLSCRDPNLQNLTNPDKYENETDSAKYPVRRAFIPRPGFFFVMIDYDQIEFRFFLDLARANGLIDEIMLKGLDVHQATANVAGVSRKHAKTVNFLTLYGGGVAKLCMDLFQTKGTQEQISLINKERTPYMKRYMTEADHKAFKELPKEMIEHNTPLLEKTVEIQSSIFNACPEIKIKMKEIQKAAEDRKYIFNWFGRRYQFPDRKFAYKAPNHLVQGGCADILKIAMNRCDEYLKNFESRMVVTIHDELVFEIKYGEEHVVNELKTIMESVYPYKKLPLTTDVEFSFDNLADKKSWKDFNKESEAARNQVQREDCSAPQAIA